MKYKFEITIDDIEDIRYDFIEDCIRDCLIEDEEMEMGGASASTGERRVKKEIEERREGEKGKKIDSPETSRNGFFRSLQ